MQSISLVSLASASVLIYSLISILLELALLLRYLSVFPSYGVDFIGVRPVLHLGGGHRHKFRASDIAISMQGDEIEPNDTLQFSHFVTCEENLPAPASGIVWAEVDPLTELTPYLTKQELRVLASAHGMRFANAINIETLRERLHSHRCLAGTCQRLFGVFKKTGKKCTRVQAPTHSPDTGGNLPSKFPPSPLSKKDVHGILTGVASDLDIESLLESGCAVCGQLVPKRNLQKRSEIDIDLSPLVRASATRRERQSGRDPVEPIHGPVLASKCDSICLTCIGPLRHGQVPRLALVNGLWMGEIPDALKGLTFAEQMMIAKVRHNRCVVRVASGRGKLTANAIMYQNPTLKIYNRLPPSKDEMAEILSIVFVGVAKPHMDDYVRTPMLVRRDRVKKALEWLKLNHSAYEELEIAWDNLKQYPLRGVPVYVDHRQPNSGDVDVNPLEKSVFSGDDDDNEWGTEAGPCPFRVHGLTGEEYEKCTTDEIKLKALQHLRSGAHSLAIGHAERPESIWENPDLYPSMFPWLFPYGFGGLGNKQLNITRFSEAQHKKFLLMYHDKRFQTDLYFPLVAFNHAQIKSSKAASQFVTDNDAFTSVTERLFSVNMSVLESLVKRMSAGEHLNLYSVESEEEKTCFRVLDDLDLIGGHVKGSITQKKYMRNEIWSMVAQLGAPSWFVTFSPVDQKHPLCLYYAGTEVEFPMDILPADERNRRIVQNPVAAARFFHFMCQLFIKHILGVGSGHPGVYGNTAGYYGTVEQQGRLTLHLHALIWVTNALTPKEIRERILDNNGAQFRKELIEYLDSCCQGEFLTGSIDDVKRWVNPQRARERRRGFHDLLQDDVDDEDGPLREEYRNPELTLPEGPPPFCEGHTVDRCDGCKQYQEWEQKYASAVDDLLLRSNQHTHTVAGPEKVKSKKGQKVQPGKGCLNEDGVCASRFPRDIVQNTHIDEKDGAVIMKHLVPMMNTVTPLLTYVMRCNTDVTSLLSGTAIQAVVLYVTNYITKSSLKTHHIFQAIIDLFHERLQAIAGDSKKDQDAARQIMMKVINVLSSKLELGSPMASLYLLDNPDHYTSHTFKLIWWKNYVTYIRRRWGIIDPHTSERVVLTKKGEELVSFRNTDDYVFRPVEYENVSLYDWVLNSTKKSVPPKLRGPSTRIPDGYSRFLDGHGQQHSHMVTYEGRDAGMRILNFVGGALPRPDTGDREYYCCTMLALFVPWRTGKELKQADETWDDAFVRTEFADWQRTRIRNFNIKYECHDARDDYHAQVKRKSREARKTGSAVHESDMESDDDELDGGHIADYAEEELFASETAELGRQALKRLKAMDEMEQIIKNAGWLDHCSGRTENNVDIVDAPKQTPTRWKKVVADAQADIIKRRQASVGKAKEKARKYTISPVDIDRVEPVDTRTLLQPRRIKEATDISNSKKESIKKFTLNQKQKEAFEIVASHATTPGAKPLKLYIAGMAGTGKSQVMKALQYFFQERGEGHRFIALAPTGTAAAALGGSTYHWTFGISGKDNPINGSEATNVRKMRSNLIGVDYIFIDEVSMISCQDLYQISSKLAKALQEPDQVFGGMNMIFAGDFAQLPPVMAKALYHPIDENFSSRMSRPKQEMYIGKAVWHQVTDVVVLTECMRQITPGSEEEAFRKCLNNLRYGNCDSDDLAFLRRRTVGPGPNRPKLSDPEIRNVAIITPYNAQKDKLNSLGTERFSADVNQKITRFYSEDSLPPEPSETKKRREKKTPRKIPQKTQEYLWSAPPGTSDQLAGCLSLCVGMPVMIRHNDATELCITKGQNGVVCGWNSHSLPDGREVLDVLFIRLVDGPREVQVPGLPPNVVPMTRTSRRIYCDLPNDDRIYIIREQVEVLPFFGMTVHASQGKSRDKNPVDVNYSVTHQSIYTALSRGRTAEGTVLVQGFNVGAVTGGMKGWLRQELREIDMLAKITELKYNGTLPEYVTGQYRRALINSYKQWITSTGRSTAGQFSVDTEKADEQWASNVDGKWRWTDKDRTQYERQREADAEAGDPVNTSTVAPSTPIEPRDVLDVGSVKALQNTNKQSQAHADALGNKRKGQTEEGTRVIKRIKTSAVRSSKTQRKGLAPNIQLPRGLRWDNIDHSCAYDSLFTCLWQLWLRQPMLASHDNGQVMNELLNSFADVLRGATTLEDARDGVRSTLHEYSATDFPKGEALTSVEAVRHALFGSTLYGTQRQRCGKCVWTTPGVRRIVFDAMTLTRGIGNSVEDWYRMMCRYKIHRSCPQCGMEGVYEQLHVETIIDNAPKILALNIADPEMEIQYRWILWVSGRPVTYRLFGIIYYSEQHFTSRFVDDHMGVWFHDGISTGSNAIFEGYGVQGLSSCPINQSVAVQVLYTSINV